jgi:hypothetical protein
MAGTLPTEFARLQRASGVRVCARRPAMFCNL